MTHVVGVQDVAGLLTVDRRVFFTGLAGILGAVPVVCGAQDTGKVYRIGFLSPGPTTVLMPPFLAAMRDLGWVEGRNFTTEARYTGASSEHVRVALAAELIERKVDLILALNSASAQAAKRASTSLPIVMLTSGFPVEAGLAASMARPGGNVTGLSVYGDGTVFAKYIQFLRELVPKLASLGVFSDYVPPGFVVNEVEASLGEMKRAARNVGITPHVFEIASRADLEQAMARVAARPVDALVVTHGPVQRDERTAAEIIAFAAKQKVPTITDIAGHVSLAGSLLTYGANTEELARRGASFVDRILRGARPGDLPIERPAKFELLVNLKTAKALGFTVPQSLLARADQVIQ